MIDKELKLNVDNFYFYRINRDVQIKSDNKNKMQKLFLRENFTLERIYFKYYVFIIMSLKFL